MNLTEEIKRSKILMGIRNILNEYHGYQLEVDSLTKILYDFVVELIQDYINKPINDKDFGFTFTIDVDDINITEKTKISRIKTDINITQTNGDTIITGKFEPKDIELIGDNEYKVVIVINLQLNLKDIKLIKTEMSNVISHELHHAYRELKLLEKQSKSKIYTKARNLTEFGLQKILNENPPLKEFMNMFYLNLQPEITARVQETASTLKNINIEDTNEILQHLMRYQPITDAKKMINYKIESLKNVDPEILKNFVEQFNKNIEKFSIEDNIITRTKNTVDSFFNYWIKEINGNGIDLFYKILNLIFDKHNTTLREEFNNLDLSLIGEITGENYY